MNAATAALLGAGIGIFGTLISTWINRHFDEKKARRELMVKTSWDHYSTLAEFTKAQGGRLAPFETYLFHTQKVIELALNESLSNEQIVEEVRKIRGLTNAIIAEIHKEKAAKAEEYARRRRRSYGVARSRVRTIIAGRRSRSEQSEHHLPMLRLFYQFNKSDLTRSFYNWQETICVRFGSLFS